MEKNSDNKIKNDKKQNSNALEYHNNNIIKESDVNNFSIFKATLNNKPLLHLTIFLSKYSLSSLFFSY